MTERLGVGELTMHFRRFVDGTPPARQQIECGVRAGCVTARLEDVTCAGCKLVAAEADKRAEHCGCRRGDVHRGHARAAIEIAGRLPELLDELRGRS